MSGHHSKADATSHLSYKARFENLSMIGKETLQLQALPLETYSLQAGFSITDTPFRARS
jgi:hypothetical protein